MTGDPSRWNVPDYGAVAARPTPSAAQAAAPTGSVHLHDAPWRGPVHGATAGRGVSSALALVLMLATAIVALLDLYLLILHAPH